MLSRRRALPIALLLGSACGGVAFVDGGGNGGWGGGAGGGAGGSGNSGGWGGSAGGAGGTCEQTHDGFAYTLQSTVPGSPSLDCSGAQPGGSTAVHLEGSFVQYLDSGGVLIDTCPPGATCDESALYLLNVQAPGLYLAGFVDGMFVQLDVQIDFPWGCAHTLLVRNLPSWGGLMSAGGSTPYVVVAGSDGSSAAPLGAPFSITAVALGCSGVDQGCGIEDDFRLDFATSTGAAPLYMGQTAWIAAPGEGPTGGLTARNLRSYETGWCDDYWNWAWWASYALGGE